MSLRDVSVERANLHDLCSPLLKMKQVLVLCDSLAMYLLQVFVREMATGSTQVQPTKRTAIYGKIKLNAHTFFVVLQAT